MHGIVLHVLVNVVRIDSLYRDCRDCHLMHPRAFYSYIHQGAFRFIVHPGSIAALYTRMAASLIDPKSIAAYVQRVHLLPTERALLPMYNRRWCFA